MPARHQRTILFALFTLSGFSGLIYESTWSHYLKLFLGHAAYAQTLVLAIFMGGMALGAGLCAKFSVRWKNLLLAYAVAEGLIGVAALLFHETFDGFLQLAYFTLIPALGSPLAVMLFKWSTAALLILPQSILLGMTFPLMSAGIIRRFPDHPGRTLATLYFTNSIGAAIGVLMSGFVLIDAIGLPGTIRTAGAINVALALAVWALTRHQSAEPTFTVAPAQHTPWSMARWAWLFIAAAALTGLASFIYEIAWIRMLSLVLGSSTHAFELMLSAFILGLALGGLWIKRRIDVIADPVRYLAAVQIVMGALALATLPLYGQSFEVMRWIVNNAPTTDLGYIGFNFASHAIAMVIMLPATFCAGMTLPLLTFTLMKQGHGEKSIGNVYAANTVGAIAGVFFATHVGMPALGLKNLLVVGAALDIALGLVLAWRFVEHSQTRWLKPATAGGIGIVLVSLLFVEISPQKMASGVFRYGRLQSPDTAEMLFHQDGKTASIDVIRVLDSTDVTISTNGKPDASVNMKLNGVPTPDEVTMALLGALPIAMHPSARDAAMIGLGSGMSTHTLVGAPSLAGVDTVEIEAAVVAAAQRFRPRVDRAFTDPKSHIHIEDAKTFFSTYGKRYDVIVSEPSNPWVSGVSSLFTAEFYRVIQHFMKDDAVLVQWIQLYEIDMDAVASIVKALSTQFANYVIYASNDDDMVLVATNGTNPLNPSADLFAVPGMFAELSKHAISNTTDLSLRKIGDRRSLQPLFASYAIAENSDYHPVLDARAAKSRYLRSSARDLVELGHAAIPITRMLGVKSTSAPRTEYSVTTNYAISEKAHAATLLRDYLMSGHEGSDYQTAVANDLKFYAQNFRLGLIECAADLDPMSWIVSVIGVAQSTLPFLSAEEAQRVWQNVQNAPCYATTVSTKLTWIQLMSALASADAEQMTNTAVALLDDAERDATPVTKFLLQAAALGALMRHDAANARQLWERYAPAAYPDGKYDLLARLYMSHAGLNWVN